MRTIGIGTTSAFFLLASGLLAQQNQTTITTSTVPRLVRITSTFHPADGQSASSVESVTLSIYRDEQIGSPLWQETQNVAVDPEGKYNLLMGSTANEGVPADLFNSSEPRWLGVKFNRAAEVEQPRIRLASVPYALKASDAETLGGRPASAYLLSASAGPVASSATPTTGTVAKPKTISGFQGYIPVFTDATNDLGDSVMQQASGSIGVGTLPGAGTCGAGCTPSLDLRTSPFSQIGMAQTTDYLTFFASDTYGPAIYWDPGMDLRFGKGGAGLYNPYGFTEQMRIQSSTGNVGINQQSPGATLDVGGTINFNTALLYQGYVVLAVPGPVSNGNTAVGVSTLPSSTTGAFNTATGYKALSSNMSGGDNTADGEDALAANTSGYSNTAVGNGALNVNTQGGSNTAVGAGALSLNTMGSGNIALGDAAGAFITGNNNIDIGSPGGYADSGVIRIGDGQTAFYAYGIGNATVSGVPVLVNTSTGQLGVASSSRRFKEDIHDMGSASDGLMRLRPVTFRYKQPFDDGSNAIQYGLIAEEVANVYPELVAHSADGQIETVKYQVLNSMLLNEIQKQQAEIKALREQLETQREQSEERLSRLEALLATANANQR